MSEGGLTGHLLQELALFRRDQPDAVNLRYQMDPSVVVVPQRGPLRPNHVHLIRPRQHHRVIPAPLHRARQLARPHLRVVLAQLILEVGLDDPDLALGRAQGHILSVWRDGDVHKGPVLQQLVLHLGRVDDEDGGARGDEHFDVAGEGVGGRHELPGVDARVGGDVRGGVGEEARARLVVA